MSRKSTRLSDQAKFAGPSTHSTTPVPPRTRKPRIPSTKVPEPAQNSSKKRRVTATHDERNANEPQQVEDRTNYSKVKGRRGQLKIMTEMPTDILLEIFGQLQPVDLLQISRATKSLRAMVTSNNTAFLWKQVYNNAPAPIPPPCPEGMNILHYTNFLYGRHCQFCAGIRGRWFHNPALIRFCSKCVSEHLLCYNVGEGKLIREVVQLCACYHLKKIGGNARGLYILKAQYDRCREEYTQAKKIPSTVKDLRERCKLDNIRRMELSRRILSWRSQLRTQEQAQHNALLASRRKAIEEKIVEEGYADELNTWRISSMPAVRVAAELTDEEWEWIRADILDVHQELCETRAEDALAYAISLRYHKLDDFIKKSTLPKPRIMPLPIQIAASEPFMSFIKETADDKDRKDESFDGMESHLFEFTKTWRETSDQLLLSLLPQTALSTNGKKKNARSSSAKGKGRATLDPSSLELAATFFKCHWCSDPIAYPRVLMHSCLRKGKAVIDDDNVNEEAVEEQEIDGDEEEEEEEEPRKKIRGRGSSPRQPRPPKEVNIDTAWEIMRNRIWCEWNAGGNQVHFDEEASGFARNIIQACGEDPDTITSSDMNKKDVRLECLRCNKDKGQTLKRSVMTWKIAILHGIEVHFDDELKVDVWKVLSEGDLAKAKEVEKKMMSRWRALDYVCYHCDRTLNKEMKGHLRSNHGINITAKDFDIHEHCGPHTDTPMKSAPLAVKI